MKRIGALLLTLALCLLAAGFALAESGPVAQSDAYAAYIDGEGRLFLPGRAEAINTHPADSVVAVDAYRVLFLGPDDFQGTEDLYMIDLADFGETLLAADVRDACVTGEDTGWYVSNADRTCLMRVDLNSASAEVAYAAGEPIDRLYVSIEGLVFELVDQAGALLYVEDTDRFEPYSDAAPRGGLLADSYEVYLTDEAELYLKNDFNYTSTLIDTGVTAFARMNGVIYYLSRGGSALRLKAYDPAAMTTRVVLTPGVRMENQLTASANALFMLTSDGQVCRVDVQKGSLAIFGRYGDLSAYSLPAEYTVKGLRIEAMSGQLNVYARLEEKIAKPDFSFIEFESQSEAAEPILKLIDTRALKNEETAWDLLKPTPQYQTLYRGSRGDAVKAIQQPLKDLGYYDYYVDGIFGPRTQEAVRLLQFDLDQPITGVADAELQRIILSGRLSAFDPYLALTRGNRGMRVRIMQERLRELGYLADAADGIFGPRTLKAVQLFQSENGMKASEGATRETLKRLYADSAKRCSSYIDLYPGDTGYRVRELNNRLVRLYYLEDSPGSAYTSETTSAVRMFQRMAGMRETGEATQAVLRALFAKDAPEAPGYILLRRGDDNDRVERLQRRLKALGYFDGKVNGYFGKSTKDAVALFQKKVGLKTTGEATVRTQQLLFASDAPEYVKPTIIGEPEIWLERFDYYEDGIYFISEETAESGYVIFNWDVEGSVDSYGVRVTDATGAVYVDTDTMLTSTGVSIATLDYDMVYTLRITAFPEDGNAKHITKSELRFVRVVPEEPEEEEEIGEVGTPVLSIEEVLRTENGVSYIKPGIVTFHWFAEGDVAEYQVEIHDEGDNEVIKVNMTDLKASVRSDAMNAGEIYTLFVYAIPVNGTIDDARVKFMRFSLSEVELPEPDPTPIPSPTPTPEPTPEPTATPEPETNTEPEETLEPVPVIEETPEPVADTTPEPAMDVTPEPEITPEPAADVTPEPEVTPEPAADVTPEPEVTPEPAADVTPEPEPLVPAAEETEAPVDNAAPEEEADESSEASEPAAQALVSAPAIAFDGVEYVEGGVTYLSGDIVTMRWQSEGEVQAYYIEALDPDGNLMNDQTTDQTALSAYASALTPGQVYTLRVTAIPVGGTVEDGMTSAAGFALLPQAEAFDEEEADTPDEAADETAESAPEDSAQAPGEGYDGWDEAENSADAQAPEEPHPEEEYPEEAYSEEEYPEEEYPEEEYPEEEYPKEEYPEEEYVENQESEEAYQYPEEAIDDSQPQEEEYQYPEEDFSDIEAPDEETEYPEEEYDGFDEPEEETVDDQEYGAYDADDPSPENFEDDLSDMTDGVLSVEEITAIQQGLVRLGWLAEGSYTEGTLDEATVWAISDFQTWCNGAFDMGLPMIDSASPSVDAQTQELLTYPDESTYANPDA